MNIFTFLDKKYQWGILSAMSLFYPTSWSTIFYYHFDSKLKIFPVSKAVSNSNICLI